MKLTRKERKIVLWAHEAIQDYFEENPDKQFEGKNLNIPSVEGSILKFEDGRDYTEYLLDLKYRLLEHYKDLVEDAFGGTPRYHMEVARARNLFKKIVDILHAPSQI